MLEDFHLVAIVERAGGRGILQVPLHRDLQRTLAKDWDEQYREFLEDIYEIEFDPGYRPEEYERFCLEDYELPDWLEGQNSESVRDLESIEGDVEKMGGIRGLVGFGYNHAGDDLLMFQNSTRSRIVRPGYYLFLDGTTYRSPRRSALCLDSRLSAVYLKERRSLIFENFRTVNTFLPLEAEFEDASDEQIMSVLGHERISAVDPGRVTSYSNQWFRKRFAMLEASGVLDDYTAEQIVEGAEEHGVEVILDGDKIVFPADRQEARRLLQYLNEERFVGVITDMLYETNSKRAAS